MLKQVVSLFMFTLIARYTQYDGIYCVLLTRSSLSYYSFCQNNFSLRLYTGNIKRN